jgi:hypothetical protein
MRQRTEEQAAAKIATLLPALRKAGIGKIIAHYDGEWGKGTIDFVSPPDLPDDIRRTLDDHIHFDLLPYGWRAEYGSEGEVILDVVHGTLKVDHAWRVVELRRASQTYALFGTEEPR